MTTQEAIELIEAAVRDDSGRVLAGLWADLGAGSGTFTFALARLLGEGGEVLAVDREAAAVESLRRGLRSREKDGSTGDPRSRAPIQAIQGDFQDPGELLGADARPVAGALFANALHFDPDPGETLIRWAERLTPGGRLVVVEYEDRPPNPWVPHPLPTAALRAVAEERGLGAVRVVGERPSSYGGVLYCAWLNAG